MRLIAVAHIRVPPLSAASRYVRSVNRMAVRPLKMVLLEMNGAGCDALPGIDTEKGTILRSHHIVALDDREAMTSAAGPRNGHLAFELWRGQTCVTALRAAEQGWSEGLPSD